MGKCAVPSCTHRPDSEECKGISFHHFPTEESMRNIWTSNIGRPDWIPAKSARICSSHFTTDCYTDSKRLKKTAVPTVFIQNVKTDKRMKILTVADVASQGSMVEGLAENLDSSITEIPEATSVSFSTNEPSEPLYIPESPSTSLIPSSSSAVPSTSVTPSVSKTSDAKVYIVRGVEPMEIDTPRKAVLLNVIRREERKNEKKAAKLRSLKRKSVILKKRVLNLKVINKDLREKFNMSLDTSQMFEGISETSTFLRKRQVDKATNKRLSKVYNARLKAFALTLNFLSPRAYCYVRQTFDTCLPHVKSLSRWYRSVNVEPGFHEEALTSLQAYSTTKETKLIVSLMIDGMSIRQHVEWDGKQHHGYVNYGACLSGDFTPVAKETLVFLVVGINASFKLPIGFFFIAGITGEQLAVLVKQAVTQLENSNVTVASLTCDGAPSNISMATNLGCSLEPDDLKPYFMNPVSNKRVFFFLDPSHMVKLVRNAFADKQILLTDSGEIRYSYVENLHHLQVKEGLHLANKITKRHIYFQDQKMKVKLAIQLMSRSSSLALEFCRTKEIPGFEDSEETSKFLKMFNDLFDALNSRSLRTYGFKKAISASNIDSFKALFDEGGSYIRSLRDNNGRSILSGARKVGFLIAMESLIGLYEEYVETKVLICIPAYKVSQDHLETFFSTIRGRGGWNNNPTARQFVASYKQILVNKELIQFSGNCIPLERLSILSYTKSSPVSVINDSTPRIQCIEDEGELTTDHDYFQSPSQFALSNYTEDVVCYIAGFVVRHLRKKIKCQACLSVLDGEQCSSLLITLKDVGGLVHPPKDVNLVCNLTEKYLRTSLLSSESCLKAFQKNEVNLVINSVFSACAQKKIMPNLLQHSMEQDWQDSHYTFLLKAIIEKYVDLRLRHKSKLITEELHRRYQRQQLTKLILFKGQ